MEIGPRGKFIWRFVVARRRSYLQRAPLSRKGDEQLRSLRGGGLKSAENLAHECLLSGSRATGFFPPSSRVWGESNHFLEPARLPGLIWR